MGFIKELFIGRKIYLTTDLPKDITKVLISKKPGYLMGGELHSSDVWRPLRIFTKDRIYYGNVNEWGGITDAGNNWQGAFTLKPTTPIYEVYTLDGWKEITAKEYEILIAISKVSVRVATRRNCIEVTDLIGLF